MATTVNLPDDAPGFVVDWVMQLTSEDTMDLLKRNAACKIDMTFYAHRGRAAKPCQATIVSPGGGGQG